MVNNFFFLLSLAVSGESFSKLRVRHFCFQIVSFKILSVRHPVFSTRRNLNNEAKAFFEKELRGNINKRQFGASLWSIVYLMKRVTHSKTRFRPSISTSYS